MNRSPYDKNVCILWILELSRDSFTKKKKLSHLFLHLVLLLSNNVPLQLNKGKVEKKIKLYSTIGLRRDHHSIAGAYYTGRTTFAYKLDNNLKIRSSFGTGLRFPTLNEYYFGSSVLNRSTLFAAIKVCAKSEGTLFLETFSSI